MMQLTYEEALNYITNDTCVLEEFTDTEICGKGDFYEALDILAEASEEEVIQFVMRNVK